MLLVHGFAGTPATWTPLLPALEQHHDVLAPTLLGHSGGPGYLAGSPATPAAMADALERDMDSAGFDQAHLVGNSLGGWLALELAVRGRALSTTALAPPADGRPEGPKPGGWGACSAATLGWPGRWALEQRSSCVAGAFALWDCDPSPCARPVCPPALPSR